MIRILAPTRKKLMNFQIQNSALSKHTSEVGGGRAEGPERALGVCVVSEVDGPGP